MCGFTPIPMQCPLFPSEVLLGQKERTSTKSYGEGPRIGGLGKNFVLEVWKWKDYG
jgi:hypothetical protein